MKDQTTLHQYDFSGDDHFTSSCKEYSDEQNPDAHLGDKTTEAIDGNILSKYSSDPEIADLDKTKKYNGLKNVESKTYRQSRCFFLNYSIDSDTDDLNETNKLGPSNNRLREDTVEVK